MASCCGVASVLHLHCFTASLHTQRWFLEYWYPRWRLPEVDVAELFESSYFFFFFLFFFRTTQKFTVTEGPYCDWESAVMLDCDPSSLESFPELAGYADSTLSRPLTGSPPGWGKDTRWGTNTYIAYRTVSLSCRRLFLFFSFLQICSQC